MSDNDMIKIEQDGHITWLTLNRPERRNTMTPGYFKTMSEIFPKLDADPEVRVIVIKGEGKSFTAGLDLVEASSLFEPPAADANERFKKKIMELQDSNNAIEKCRKPVIAAAHSHCIGGGVDLLSACDIRIATRDTVFAIRETKMAMIADLGTLQRMPSLIGFGRFQELALTGRNFSAEEALQMGFITKILEDKEELYAEAKRLAEEIAESSPIAVQGVKEVILYSRENGIYPGLEYVAQKNAAVLPCEDLMEAFSAFMQKRKPVFKGK